MNLILLNHRSTLEGFNFWIQSLLGTKSHSHTEYYDNLRCLSSSRDASTIANHKDKATGSGWLYEVNFSSLTKAIHFVCSSLCHTDWPIIFWINTTLDAPTVVRIKGRLIIRALHTQLQYSFSSFIEWVFYR